MAVAHVIDPANCQHDWSLWYECVDQKHEYRICYLCWHRQTEPVTDPPRWILDHVRR